jgi:CRISPR system Cascade subunit CasE
MASWEPGMTEPLLRLLRLELDAARLAREGLAAGLPPTQEDLGFLVHAALAGLFGEGAVQPFRVLDATARQVPVLGYTRHGEDELREHAAAFADPARYAACAWDCLASKPMPELAAGRRLGFELRACPVVRLAGELEVAGKDGVQKRYGAGQEIDSWVHRRFMARESEEVSREAAYAEWLRERMGAAAEVTAVRLDGFRRLRLVRRDHSSPRKSRVLERPDVLLRGDLELRDGEAFGRLLARGVGRHRAYGFGMLLLRPPVPC